MFKSSDLLGILICMTYPYKSWRWNEQRNIKVTWHSTALDHQMPLPEGYFWLANSFSMVFFRMSRWPYIVLILATRCFYCGVHLLFLTHLQFYALLHRGLFYKRPTRCSTHHQNLATKHSWRWHLASRKWILQGWPWNI